ncbi:MAG: SDH family Clp fold serine proteinase [Elainellaceae cyanobacterium]
MNFWNLFLIFIVISSLQPAIQRRITQYHRLSAIQNFERKRGSRMILLIHRQEAIKSHPKILIRLFNG